MRNRILSGLIAYLFLLTTLLDAQGVVVRRRVVSSGACTTPTGAQLTESWGDTGAGSCGAWTASTGCNQTWTIYSTGTGAIASSPAGSGANTACTNSLHLTDTNQSNGNHVYRAVPASSWGLQSATVDIYYNIYWNSFTIGSSASADHLFLSTQTYGGAYRAYTFLYNSAGTYRIGVSDGATNTLFTGVAVTTGTWYDVHVHLASGAGASSLQVNGGTAVTFTQGANDAAYILVGTKSGKTQDYYIGYLQIN